MPLQLITGPANSAKAGVVVERLTEQPGEGALLVVPTVDEVANFRREIAQRGVVFGVEVVVFDRLISQIAEGCGGQVPLVGALQRQAVMHSAIDEAELKRLKPIAQKPGFVVALERTFAELLRANLLPEQLKQALGHEELTREQTVHELAAIYSGYIDGLDQLGKADRELQTIRTLQRFEQNPQGWAGRNVVLYGFDELSGIQLETITLLAGVGQAQLTVSLNYEAERLAFKAREREFQTLLKLADSHQQLPASAEYYSEGSRTQLAGIERQLFEDVNQPLPATDSVQLLVAEGVQAELELIAAEITALTATGMPPSQIAVVFRNPESYIEPLKQIFSSYDLTTTATSKLGSKETAIGSGFLTLLRCVLQPHSATAADLVRYLRYPGVSDQLEVIDRFERNLRQAGIDKLTAALKLWDKPIESFQSLTQHGDDHHKLVAELRQQLSAMMVAQTAAAGKTLASDQGVEQACYQAIDTTLTELERSPRALWKAASRANTTEAAVVELIAELTFKYTDQSLGEHVAICSPHDLRARRFDAVFIAGLQQGEFPNLGSNDPLISEQVRAKLSAVSGRYLQTQSDREATERYRFYLAASRAREKLYLSYRTADSEGKTAQHSHLVDEVTNLFETPLTAKHRRLADVIWQAEQAPNRRQQQLAELAKQQLPNTQQPTTLPAVQAAQAARGRPYSARELESFARCPVRWLIEQQLRPEQLEPLPDVLLRGTIAHDVIEATLQQLGDGNEPAAITSQNLQQAKVIAGKQLTEILKRKLPELQQLTLIASYHRLQVEIHKLIEHEAHTSELLPFAPKRLEWAFGNGQTPPLLLGEDGVEVSGRIDRIDTTTGGSSALLIDYKTTSSAADYAAAKWLPLKQLQLGLYMLAVKQILGLEVTGAVYRAIAEDDPRPRGIVLKEALAEGAGAALYGNDLLEDQDFEELLVEIERQAAAAAQQLQAGEIQPQPESCSKKGECAYPSICAGGACG